MTEHIRASCRALYRVLSDYFDGTLSEEDARQVRGHIAACPPCGVYLEQFRTVYQSCGTVEPADLPDDFCNVMDRVLGAWKSGAARCGPAADGDPQPDPADDDDCGC